MANIIKIDSILAPELDIYARLTQAQLKNKAHPQQGLFIAEGLKVIEIALSRGLEPVSFLIEERHIEGKAAALLETLADVPVYTAGEAVLEKLTGYRLTRGVLCAMKRPEDLSAEAVCCKAKRLAIVEDVVDASNLGAIFRCAAALGMDGLLLSPGCCDPLYRKAVRTSMGTVFQLPWARFTGQWPEDGMGMLRRSGFSTAALALDADAVSIDCQELSKAERLAVILGTEGSGLKAATIEMSDFTVYIPMENGVDSLNVAAAAAIAFWQLRKK